MKILIFGENGQLAQEFKKLLPQMTQTFQLGKNDVLQVGSAQANFLKPDQVVQILREYKPTHIINASAYTAVDKAETERDQALQINATTVGIIGEVAKKQNSHVIHYSTDYVYSGRSSRPYLETDPIEPINYYGYTKAGGDQNLADTGCYHQIFRVSWVYGVFGNNFLKTMLRLGKERPELKVVQDQQGIPTASFEIAKNTLQVLKDAALSDKSGIYHMSPQGQTTWHGFTEQIIHLAKSKNDKFQIITEQVTPISSDQFVSAAQRPKYSVMSSQKLKNDFGLELPEWQESLKHVLFSK